jgi:ribosomal-protein-alanine N-acetyltransferase
MDWRRPVDWIGSPPFFVAERYGKLVAALACPLISHPVSWLRLYAVSRGVSENQLWRILWEEVENELFQTSVRVSVIPMEVWFQELLRASHFEHSNNVVVLSWDWTPSNQNQPMTTWHIRSMTLDDLPVVQEVDSAAFDPVWQNPAELLKDAFNQAAVATVAETDGRIIGYQISTANPEGGHLARLAVEPSKQNKGVGTALVQDMIAQFRQFGAIKITVNTQTDNLASLALYEKNGFQQTEKFYPVYQKDL